MVTSCCSTISSWTKVRVLIRVCCDWPRSRDRCKKNAPRFLTAANLSRNRARVNIPGKHPSPPLPPTVQATTPRLPPAHLDWTPRRVRYCHLDPSSTLPPSGPYRPRRRIPAPATGAELVAPPPTPATIQRLSKTDLDCMRGLG